MIRYIIPSLLLFFTACSGNDNAPAQADTPEKKAAEKQSFFPVTAYLKGQLYDIRQKGLTPVKYTIINGHTDSVMIKFDHLDSLAKEFLQPQIDSTNLVAFYTESKFLDQTVNAFTFTYEPKNPLPDSLQLLHWDVYVDPETGKVKRVYLVKKQGPGQTLQLTWENNQWFKTTTIKNNTDGSSTIEKEEKISWDY